MSQLKEYFFGKIVKSKPDEQFTIKRKKVLYCLIAACYFDNVSQKYSLQCIFEMAAHQHDDKSGPGQKIKNRRIGQFKYVDCICIILI